MTLRFARPFPGLANEVEYPRQEHLGSTRERVDVLDFDVGQRLKELRTAAGLSQRQLAARAGVPHAQISMIESNRSSPSVASLRKILGGIPLTMTEFFEPDRGEATNWHFRPEELIDLTSRLYTSDDACSRRLTLRQVGNARAHNLQILHEHYEPGADTGPSMLEHDAHEGGIVISGQLEVTVAGVVRLLGPGEAYLFDSRQPHRFRNVGDCRVEVFSACTPPYL